MRRLKNQKGFTFTPAVFILVLLMMAGATYLIYIRSVGKTERKLENTQIAKYAAETGIYHIKAQLTSLNIPVDETFVNKWFNAKYPDNRKVNTNYDHIFTSDKGDDESKRTALNTSRTSKDIDIKEDPTNKDSRIIGRYRITIEDGSLQSGSNKTVTGNIQEGIDRYNNEIWDDTINKNYFKELKVTRYGVRVDGYAVNGAGVNVPGAQSIYAVLDVPANSDVLTPKEWGNSSPASYLLSTNGITEETDPTENTYNLNLMSNQIITGPIHTNERLDFLWRGNFNVFVPLNPSINDQFTVALTRRDPAVYSYENGCMFVTSILRETGQPATQITIYGMGFNATTTNNWVSFNGAAWRNDVIVSAIKPDVTKPDVTKLVVNIPSGITAPYTISVGTSAAAAGPFTINSNIPVNQPISNPLAFKILGIMRAARPNTGTEDIYIQANKDGSGGGDYVFLDPARYPTIGYGGIDWSIAGDEPAKNQNYIVTYITDKNIPHKRIDVYGKITYSNAKQTLNATPKMYYIHAHKSKWDNLLHPYTKNHDHRGNIFGKITGRGDVDFAMNSKPDSYLTSPPVNYYDWSTKHKHEITGYTYSSSDGECNTGDTFFCFEKASDEPTYSPGGQIAPILKPNGANAYTQREYAAKILEITGVKTLKRDKNNNLESLTSIPEDRNKGYYVGSQDFRATYFGNDLKYTDGTLVLPAGSNISDTAVIRVNDNPNSADYMKVYKSNNTSSTDNKLYTYRQIPKNAPVLMLGKDIDNNYVQNLVEGGIIFVNEGYVRIGGMSHKGTVNTTGYVGENDMMGRNTIIDGRLAIISYSESKPSVYVDEGVNTTTDSFGDIVITGNVIYKNKIYKYKEQITSPTYTNEGFRQYAISGASTPSNINDSSINWITSSDGSTVTDSNGVNKKYTDTTGNETKINSLGLFASNCIKIPVMHYYQDSNEDSYDATLAKQDILTIHGQLVAGHRITQTKFADFEKGKTSKNDQLIMFGSFYSYNPPNLSYFDLDNPRVTQSNNIARIYLFDKTLSRVPLSGAPFFPKDTSYSENSMYIPGITFPKIVPGTWKNVSQGIQ